MGSQRAMSSPSSLRPVLAVYAAFTVLVLALLVVDLGVFHRRRTPSPCAKPPSGAVWFALAMLFAGVVYGFAHWRLSSIPDSPPSRRNAGKMAAQPRSST